MSEQQNADATAEATDTQETEQAPAPKPTETVDFWKQKAREQEKRAKDNADAAKRLSEIEEANKTAEQKAAEKLAEIESRAAELAAKEARADVASETGLPVNILAGPQGSTVEDIKAYAELLSAYMEQAGKPRTPRPDPNQGRQGGGTQSTADLFAAAIEPHFTR